MLARYFKTAFRNIVKNKLINGINIVGLAISLAAFIFIFQFVKKELSYDQGHPNFERLYRVAEMIKSENYLENSSSVPYPLGPTLKAEFPDVVENQVRFFDFQVPIVTIELEDKRKFNERSIYFVDSTVFEVMDYKMVQGGNGKRALSRPFTAVISRDLARKYFGDEDPMGKKITREGFQTDFEVTGIFETNSISHIQVEMMLSTATLQPFQFLQNQWVWNPAWTYILLKENATVADLEQNKFPVFIEKYYDPRTKDKTTHYLMPIADVHLKSHLEFEMGANSDMKYVYIFISCAFFLILIAVVNFINLSTSFSLLRAKEIGVRKVSGAPRSQLITQFLSESVVIAVIAYVLALGFCYFSMSYLKDLLHMEASEIFNPQNLFFHFGIVLLIGLVSGIYPAFFISSFDPLLVFKGKFISNAKGQFLRKGLVISQFTIAIVLIIFTYVTYQQLQLLNSKDYGYHADDVVVLNAVNIGLFGRYEAFKTALKENTSVESITLMSDLIGTNNNNHDFHHEGMQPGTWNFYPALQVDEDFVKTMGLKLVAGRDYSKEYQRDDSLSILINTTMVKTLGYATPDEAIGKQLNSLGGNEKIIGVVQDFNYKSFHSEIGPFVLDLPQGGGNGGFFARAIAIKVSNVDNATLGHIQKVWEEFVPNKPFSYSILSDNLKSMYRSENNLGSVLAMFAALTVIIACLGLFALATFIAQQKTKEIGIRKVLGASMIRLFYVGYKEQLYLVLGSFTLAVPIAYLLVTNWLSDFAYRIPVGIMPFALAGFLAIAISSLTVFSNFYKTITADPADVLRDE